MKNRNKVKYCPHCGEKISGQGEYRQRRESTWTMIQAIVLFFVLLFVGFVYLVTK